MHMNETKSAVDEARQACNTLHESIAACRGKAEEIGKREELCTLRERLEEEKESILWQLDAIRLAKESLVRANAELTGRSTAIQLQSSAVRRRENSASFVPMVTVLCAASLAQT